MTESFIKEEFSIATSRLFDKTELLKDFKLQRWFAQQDQEIDTFEILDWVQIPLEDNDKQERLYWLKINISDTHTYSVLVRRYKNKLTDAASHQGFIEQLKLAGQAGLITEQGATIKLVGAINSEIITHIESLQEASSNTLHCLNTHNKSAQDKKYVLKSYRLLDASEANEVGVLCALSSQGITPKLAGVIEYHHASGVNYLGAITEFALGEPIHRLYSRAIRSLIAELNSSIKQISDIENETEALQPLSHKIGRHTYLFHQQLNKAFAHQLNKNSQLKNSQFENSARGFDFSAFLIRIKGRWRSVYQAIKHDQSIADDYRENILQLLRSCAKRLLKSQHTALDKHIPITIAHNDLHLAHVFVDTQDDYYCRIIDPSPVSLKAEDAQFSEQMALNDMVTLHRGLEYFSFDEIVDAIAHYLQADANHIAERLLIEPEKLAQDCPHLFPLLGGWSSQVVGHLADGYQAQTSSVEPLLTTTEQQQLYNAFYFNRLLQELDYNYAYGRQFFKLCDIYYLQQFTKQLSTQLTKQLTKQTTTRITP